MNLDSPNKEAEISTPKSKVTTFILLLFLFFASLISIFLGVKYLHSLIEAQKNYVPNSSSLFTPSPVQSPTEHQIINRTEPLTGKGYYDDTIIAMTSDFPRQVIVATATREETVKGVIQNSRVSYFDGDKWTRKVLSITNPTIDIYTNSLISRWEITIDPSRVLK